MIKDVIKEVILKYLERNKIKNELKVIIENYLLPETVDNLYELAKVKSLIPAYGIKFNIFDVVHQISPENFEVGNFHFPFIGVRLDFTSFNKVENKIMTSNDDDIMFFKKVYQAFKIVDKRGDLNRFKMHEYKIFSEAIKLAFKNEDILKLINNN